MKTLPLALAVSLSAYAALSLSAPAPALPLEAKAKPDPSGGAKPKKPKLNLRTRTNNLGAATARRLRATNAHRVGGSGGLHWYWHMDGRELRAKLKHTNPGAPALYFTTTILRLDGLKSVRAEGNRLRLTCHEGQKCVAKVTRKVAGASDTEWQTGMLWEVTPKSEAVKLAAQLSKLANMCLRLAIGESVNRRKPIGPKPPQRKAPKR